MINERELSKLYHEVHNIMRNIDGLQPQESLDELLKYLFFKQNYEDQYPDDKEVSVHDVKKYFYNFLGKTNSWSSEIWREKKFYISDDCLADVHKILFPIKFSNINYDVRSHAIKEFLTPEIRRGLGIYLTPDNVVSAIVDYILINNENEKVKMLDPACGSGSFIIEYLKKLKNFKKVDIYGFDKNPRMLLISDLNIGHFKNIKFNKKLTDSLKEINEDEKYDLIMTNPPFGVTLDSRDYDFNKYFTCQDSNGYPLKKQSSEIVFIEKCFQLLKPGGSFAIVIPKSIATNNNLQVAREALSKYGYIYSVMSLPPETFAATGTQTTTIVLFLKKYYSEKESIEPINVAVATIKNVGYDSTGRLRQGNQLSSFSSIMKQCIKTSISQEYVEIINYNSKFDTFKSLSNIFIEKKLKKGDCTLESICEYIGTGKTPPRNEYSDKGDFVLKVGNLTGAGINWDARDRNFITKREMEKRENSSKPLILKNNDIVMTSSAHSPVYIAKKSDIFTGIPEFVPSNNVSYVGEIMLIRANYEKIDPYVLLAFLRAKETIVTIQKMVRGQTAHLHPSDLANLAIPKEVFEKDSIFSKAAKLIKRQSELNIIMNQLVSEQNRLLN